MRRPFRSWPTWRDETRKSWEGRAGPPLVISLSGARKTGRDVWVISAVSVVCLCCLRCLGCFGCFGCFGRLRCFDRLRCFGCSVEAATGRARLCGGRLFEQVAFNPARVQAVLFEPDRVRAVLFEPGQVQARPGSSQARFKPGQVQARPGSSRRVRAEPCSSRRVQAEPCSSRRVRAERPRLCSSQPSGSSRASEVVFEPAVGFEPTTRCDRTMEGRNHLVAHEVIHSPRGYPHVDLRVWRGVGVGE
ncbi:hypothetical protein LX15_002763 [Streptoalloteichus tenebrarius]|uniref:Uncharacterized protein n=1 Tax=Streptoalloteichus tenebrarius (strain ATCC 17920 / DSM 40477 / JCM 4838 / CBS 697.72 / NBRC 16177 / NCIMB 11028 / NRRL B-12390 / A12253. 1 / ISP 5477) TaxID=1933 RepID=A0ABT1HU81_STRSD|nr:hypothetical protein [Streptoalloteichus tenebrarius]